MVAPQSDEAKLREYMRNEVPLALAESLKHYDIDSDDWKQAKTEIESFSQLIERILRSNGGVSFLQSIGTLNRIKDLIPQSALKQVEKLPIQQFCLGIIYATPYLKFESIYQDLTHEAARKLSQQGRQENDSISNVYGEILFLTFADILDVGLKHARSPNVFVDLGSGSGQAVVAAALLHSFSILKGIESIETLHQEALRRKQQFDESGEKTQELTFIHDDFLSVDWADADFVFCHGTCFDDKMWRQISERAESLRSGSIFVSTTHVLCSSLYEVVEKMNCIMAWGSCTVYIHKRRAVGKWASRMLGPNRKAIDKSN